MAKIFNIPTEYDALVVGDPCLGSDASAFTVNAEGKGVLLSRMTNAQMLAIVNPPNGLLVFNTTTNRYFHYDVNTWVEMGSGAGGGGNLTPRIHETMMSNGIGTYILPELPMINTPVEVRVNGVGVDFNLVGVNLTITEYSPGSIESSDELSVTYFI